MNLHKLLLTENACYKAGDKIKVKGIMVHSTAANNPWLKRYVGPDDGKLGNNAYGNHWNTYHPGGPELPATGSNARQLFVLCGFGIMLMTLVYGMISRRKWERE